MTNVTTTEAQALLGLASPAAARVQLARWGITATGRDTDTGEKTWPADLVRAKIASRPGRGARTDWVVWTMDHGVIYRAPRYAAASDWAAACCSDRRPRRIKAGLYEVTGDSGTTYYVSTPAQAAAEGVST